MRSWVVRLSSCPHRTPLHSPSAMARHALRSHEFKVLLRLLQRDPAVRVGSHRDLRRFPHGVHYLLRTGIPWQDLPRRFGHGNSLSRSATQLDGVGCGRGGSPHWRWCGRAGSRCGARSGRAVFLELQRLPPPRKGGPHDERGVTMSARSTTTLAVARWRPSASCSSSSTPRASTRALGSPTACPWLGRLEFQPTLR